MANCLVCRKFGFEEAIKCLPKLKTEQNKKKKKKNSRIFEGPCTARYVVKAEVTVPPPGRCRRVGVDERAHHQVGAGRRAQGVLQQPHRVRRARRAGRTRRELRPQQYGTRTADTKPKLTGNTSPTDTKPKLTGNTSPTDTKPKLTGKAVVCLI